jgi:protochlorophyllide reductase
MPRQTGRTVLVTGATSGLGLATATVLAAAGPGYCSPPATASAARPRWPGCTRDGGPDAELVELDLADLGSVRRAAADVRDRTGDSLHVLVNNAGVMGTPYGLTVDGFETQMGTDHLGHAALTWLLMPALRAAGAARVVTVSSLAHRGGGLDVDDLAFTRRPYRAGTAYSAAKLANLLFAAELDRRLRGVGYDVISVAAHPGLTDTELFASSARSARPAPGHRRPVGQQADHPAGPGRGAPPAVRGDRGAGQGRGLHRPGALRGDPRRPRPARRSAAARDVDLAARLWDATAAATGVAPDPA